MCDKALGRDFEKLQKVEKHLEDPSYEIDVTLWK